MTIHYQATSFITTGPLRSNGSPATTPSQLAAGVRSIQANAGVESTDNSMLNGRINELDLAQDNVAQAVSFTQTQDAYLQIAGKALGRMTDLAQLAQDPGLAASDRAGYQAEFERVQAVLTDVSGKEFNGEPLFSGNDSTVAVDSNGTVLTLPGVALGQNPYRAVLDADLKSPSDASDAFSKVQLSITQLSQDHAGIGASQSQLNSAADQLAVSRANLAALTVRITDADAAAAAVAGVKQQILAGPDTAMSAQANARPQRALRLVP